MGRGSGSRLLYGSFLTGKPGNVNLFGYGFGGFNYGFGNGRNQYQDNYNNGNAGSVFTVGGGYTTLEIEVTLEVKED